MWIENERKQIKLPMIALESLRICNFSFYQTYVNCRLFLPCTIPVTTASAARGFAALLNVFKRYFRYVSPGNRYNLFLSHLSRVSHLPIILLTYSKSRLLFDW